MSRDIKAQIKEKTVLFNQISGNKYINNELNKWLNKIFQFIENNNCTYHAIFCRDPGIQTDLDPQSRCGYVEIHNRNDYQEKILKGHLTMREKLYVIYQFSLHLSLQIWQILITNTIDETTIDTRFGGIKKDVLLEKVKYSLIELLKNSDIKIKSEDVECANNDLDLLKETATATATATATESISTLNNSLQNIVKPLILNGTRVISYFMKKSMTYVTAPNVVDQQAVYTKDDTREILAAENPIAYKVFKVDLIEKLSANEKSIFGPNLEPIKRMPWKNGASLFGVKVNSPFMALAQRNNKFIISGPSGTTQLILECARLFDIDLEAVFLSSTYVMNNVLDHSLFEIVFMGQEYFIYDKLNIDDSDRLRVPEANEAEELHYVRTMLLSFVKRTEYAHIMNNPFLKGLFDSLVLRGSLKK